MSLRLILNGQEKKFAALEPASPIASLLQELQIKPDRVAVELNGSIVPRTDWAGSLLAQDDKLEIVHFVGGGCNRPMTVLQRISQGSQASKGPAGASCLSVAIARVAAA